MTHSMMKAMMEAQKKARMDVSLRRGSMSSSQKVVYVPPATATITKVVQEANCE